jgi:hypothetical protein
MAHDSVPTGANVEETGFTLEGRVLCGDDACVGTIGRDRRCKVCGRPYDGAEPVDEGASPAASKADGGEPSIAETDPPAHDRPDGATATADERTCCPDDACIGIIGPNGACGICGKKRTLP